eukprot:COSAG01_NODE_37650_length_500_cov_3.925187_1_plen_52_part_10
MAHAAQRRATFRPLPPINAHVERPRSTVHIVCNPVVAGWRCMAAGWLHACNS